MGNNELDVDAIFKKLKELGTAERPKYATDFIIQFLGKNRTATTAELRAALRDAGISIKNSSLNWTLTNLNTRGDIQRISRGKYRIQRPETKLLDDASAFAARGLFVQALVAYNEAIRRFPAEVVAYNGRSETLRRMGRFEEALAAYDEAIGRFPDNAVSHNGRSELLRTLGRFEEALAAYDEAMRRFPDEVVTHSGRAETLHSMGRFEEALAAYDQAIKRFPVGFVYNGRAETLRSMGRFEEALAAYDQAIKRFPVVDFLYNGRAETLRSMGRFEEALAAYDEVIKRFPQSVVAHNGRAEVLRALGRREDALRAIDPEDTVPQQDRAEGLREIGRFETTHTIPPPADAIPAPVRRAFQFASAADGPIDLAALSQAGEHLIGGSARQEDFSELRMKAGDVAVLGSNWLGRLNNPINRFLDLNETVDRVRVNLFWSRINSLRIILLSHEQSAETRNGEPDDRRLEPTVASLLRDLVETINVFVVGDPGLMELDAVRPGPQETEVAKQEATVLAPVIEDLANSPRVATESAREVLSEQAENLEIADASLPGRQAAEFGRRSFQNFVGELLRRAYAPVRDLSRQVASEGGTAWKGVREGAYRAVGAGLITGGVTDLVGATDFSGAIIHFVVRHAEALIAYVNRSFQNPTIVEIINWIIRFGS
jgi:tetratricopeptide (TPR) repeat protein